MVLYIPIIVCIFFSFIPPIHGFPPQPMETQSCGKQLLHRESKHMDKRHCHLLSHDNDNIHPDEVEVELPQTSISWKPQKPLLALITEPDAVSSSLRMEQTFRAISKAISSGCVDLISIRCVEDVVDKDDDVDLEGIDFQERVITLTKRILSYRNELRLQSSSKWKNSKDMEDNEKRLPQIVINDNLEAVLASGADGIHVKERNVKQIRNIRTIFESQRSTTLSNTIHHNPSYLSIIGTSCHSVESSREVFTLNQNNKPRQEDSKIIDYLFVGTCYMTQSHPEKTNEEDLEGPTLPGLVRQTLLYEGIHKNNIPKIFAIGGINEENCWEPVDLGADGVAMIRSIMQADNPESVARSIHKAMKQEIL